MKKEAIMSTELTPAGGGLSDTIASLTRTYVPYLVGLVIGWLVTVGVTLPEEAKGALVALLSFLIGSAWYALARLLESKWPSLGWLIGYPVQPAYKAAIVTDAAATAEDPAVITSVGDGVKHLES